MNKYLIEGVNPEPWTSPEVSLKWVGGKPRPVVYKRQQLLVYQEALAEEIVRLYPGVVPMEGDLEVQFFFWRQVAEGDVGGRKQHANYADATNIQKATEDALQKILYDNDRAVKRVTSELIAQGPEVEPCILICIRSYVAGAESVLRDWLEDARLWANREGSSRRTAIVDDDLF